LDLPEADMRPEISRRTVHGKRRTWQSPTVTTVAIRDKTKSARTNGQAIGKLTEPPPPATPATKLGFAFEMAFPLSARIE
jgi:hypothetical protein